MMRPATAHDAAKLEAFLSGDVARTMFLRGNLARYGLAASDHPYATAYHLHPATGPVAGVLGVTRSGMVLCHAVGAPGFVAAAVGVLAPHRVTGFSGHAALTGALIAGLRLPEAAFRRNHVEPLMRLDLRGLPKGDGVLRRAEPADEGWLADWFAAFLQETGLSAGDPAAGVAEARARARDAIGDSPVRILVVDGVPVATASFNASAGTAVQVGGVYVPAAFRNRGYGREVTRALLAEAAAGGARQAVLFANNPAAVRAYRAIGFRQVGDYRIAFLDTPMGAA